MLHHQLVTTKRESKNQRGFEIMIYDHLASDTGVKLAATSFPNTRGYVLELVRLEKLMAEPYYNMDVYEKLFTNKIMKS